MSDQTESFMDKQNRKSFLNALGIIGAGALLTSGMPVPVEQKNETPGRTEPVIGKPTSKRALRVAHMTDIHIKPEKIAEYGMRASLQTLAALSDKADFIINGGDAIMNSVGATKSLVKEQWNQFNTIFNSENNLPVYNCLGNHDLWGWMLPSADHADGKKWAMDEYGMAKPYYSFSKKGWKFIVLDSIHARKSIPGYYGKLDGEQMDWLKSELKSTPADVHVCIVSHIPILAICCLFDGGLFGTEPLKISDNNMHADSQELAELFYNSGNVRACLSGHIHLIDYVNYLGTEYYCNGAVAGGWWSGNHQHFAPAYALMNFNEDGTTSREVHYYKWKA